MKTLYLDIETSPNIVTSWRVGYNINLTPDNIIQERKIIMVAYKWEDKKQVHILDWGLKKQCDKKLLQKLSEIINQADIVIGHNIDKFDFKWIKGRVIAEGLPPLKPVKTVDTLKIARRLGYFNSNRLDYLGDYFGVGRKLETGGLSLWTDIVLKQCKKAMDKMKRYNKQDVILLQKVHEILRPHDISTVASHVGSPTKCANCKSESYQKRGYTVAASPKRIITCTDCGTSRRITKSEWKKNFAGDF